MLGISNSSIWAIMRVLISCIPPVWVMGSKIEASLYWSKSGLVARPNAASAPRFCRSMLCSSCGKLVSTCTLAPFSKSHVLPAFGHVPWYGCHSGQRTKETNLPAFLAVLPVTVGAQRMLGRLMGIMSLCVYSTYQDRFFRSRNPHVTICMMLF